MKFKIVKTWYVEADSARDALELHYQQRGPRPDEVTIEKAGEVEA